MRSRYAGTGLVGTSLVSTYRRFAVTEAARDTVADRYGVHRSKRFDRRFAWIAGGAAALLGISVLAFGNWYQNTTGFQDISFTTNEANADGVYTASAKFQVSSEPNVAVSCAVEALNSSKATVGWKIIELPISDSREHTVTANLVTVGPAVSAYAKSCWQVEE